MDSKISEFPVASIVPVGALMPIVVSGANQVVTAGVFSLNLPNLGNKGITKNVVTTATVAAIPFTTTLVVLPVAVTPSFTLANGGDGQEIKLIAFDAVTVTPNSSTVASIQMGNNSSVTLVFVSTKWVPLSNHNCTFT